ncbi:MAG: hypothetical protein LBQ12_14765 [Deltaproteobacteria bacterium]|nr:hypothetical protein [Deltaproteobacteria bacterium]
MEYQTLIVTRIPGPAAPGVQGAGAALASARACWEVASAAINREISPAAARILAEPSEGPGGAVAWHTPLEGEARELASLRGPEKDRALAAVRAASGRLSDLGKRLSLSRDGGGSDVGAAVSSAAAALSAKADGRPGKEYVFVVAGVPVLACWVLPGCVPPVNGRAPPRAASAAAPASVAVAAAAAPPEVPPPSLPPSGCGESGPGGAGNGGALRAAVAASVAFLAVLLVFLAFSPGLRKAVGAAGATDPMAGVENAREEPLRYELGALKSRYLETLAACRAEEPEPPPEGSAPDLPDPEREENPPPASAEAPVGLEAASNAPKPGEELAFPEGSTDLAVLEGCWKVDSITSEHTGHEVFFIHCFDTSGRSKSTGYYYEGSRKFTCRGTSRASFPSGGKLTVSTGRLYCSRLEGNYIRPRTLRCAARATGAAACTLTDHGRGGVAHRTRITRQ